MAAGDPGDPNNVLGGDPGGQAAGGIAGMFGKKTKAAVGPNTAAYTQQMNTAGGAAADYRGQSDNYTQNAPTIANQYQPRSRSAIGGNVGAEQGLADTLVNNHGEASKAQFQEGLDKGIDAQTAMANSAPGGAVARAGAIRNAQRIGATTQAQGAATAAELGARERETALGQAAGVYGQVGGQLQSQYDLEQRDAQHQADLQSVNQQQQNNMRLGMGSLGVQSQGQSLQALNDYTNSSLDAQKLSQGIKESNAADTNGIVGTIGGVLGGAVSDIGGLFAQGGLMHGEHVANHTLASLYGPAVPAQPTRAPTLSEALAGIEHLKAHVARLVGYNGG